MGPVKQYTSEKVDGPLTVTVYPGANGSFLLYEDDGSSFNYRKGEWMGLQMALERRAQVAVGEAGAGFQIAGRARSRSQIRHGREARRLPRTPCGSPVLSIIAVMHRWLLLLAAAASISAQTNADLKEQVRKTELAFAKTMADRDHTAFASFLADETVFFGAKVTRGAKAVAEQWKPFYEAPKAPFSWAPDAVEVLDSGTLALSSGPVFDPDGKRIGTFNSVWKRQPDGNWKIVFDKGCPACTCK